MQCGDSFGEGEGGGIGIGRGTLISIIKIKATKGGPCIRLIRRERIDICASLWCASGIGCT